MRIVWTAHNVLPHEPVFADDASGRRSLVASADLVLAHSKSTLTELTALGANVLDKAVVIPHGPFTSSLSGPCQRRPGTGGSSRNFLFFGRVEEYKGVDELLIAFTQLPADVSAQLTVAGECSDSNLKSRLIKIAQSDSVRIILRLGRIPEEEISPLFAETDVVVLPFRRVTTSGSAMLALSHGRPIILPDLASLSDLPNEAVVRYNGDVQSLTAALAYLAQVDSGKLISMSRAAYAYTSNITWPDIAQKTMCEMASILHGKVGSRLAR